MTLEGNSKNLTERSSRDMEQSEYKWAGNSNVNAAWTSEVEEQFEYMYRLFFFYFLALKR